MQDKIYIILPQHISILRDKRNQDICTDKEEFSIYFRNIIYPYSTDYDIQVECEYGKNLGDCWRIDKFDDDVTDFTMKIKVYKDFGRLAAEKECSVRVLDKAEAEECTLLCIGDSMTRCEVYIRQAVNKARNIRTVGLRNIGFDVNHEGRGGWTTQKYFERFDDRERGGVSPFLFPKGVDGKAYFGDVDYWERVNDTENSGKYSYAGIKPQTISDGMVCVKDGVLYRYEDGEYKEIDKNPQFEFDFGKYIERYGVEKPNIVSLLFGANEFQVCGYEKFETELEKYIGYIDKMIESVKRYDDSISIIINMPVCGGDQYSWGNALGCTGSAKQYDYCIKMASDTLVEKYDGRQNEDIYLCPMLAVCDTVAGFPQRVSKSNIYSDRYEKHCDNWVHPDEAGYRQTGDALAAVITEIRQ